MNQFLKLKNTVIDNGFCIGCGACVFASQGSIAIKRNQDGKLEPLIENFDLNDNDVNVLDICPFYNSEYNENIIAEELFSETNNISHNKYLGFYLSNYVGFVKTDDFRIKGSSGGFGSWIATKLLDENIVDKVIHVKSSGDDILFKYQISSNREEILEGSKSKYYPIEMSEVLEYITHNDYRYLIVGLPCFIKSVRQLQKKYPILKKRILFTMGLVCGHLKSDFFAKTMAWELGIHPDNLKQIDFRVKRNNGYANNYSISVSGTVDLKQVQIEAPTKNLLASNWGYGLFKYKACDYCDDVLAETADVTIGDAWLPEYINDDKGTNIITIRNKVFEGLLLKFQDEIQLEQISSDRVYESQSGGFRHRREGLQYRLHLLDRGNDWRPVKRLNASNKISKDRRKIYQIRLKLTDLSFLAYKKALKLNDFNVIKNELKSTIRKNNKLYRGNIFVYYFSRLTGIMKSLFKRTK